MLIHINFSPQRATMSVSFLLTVLWQFVNTDINCLLATIQNINILKEKKINTSISGDSFKCVAQLSPDLPF